MTFAFCKWIDILRCQMEMHLRIAKYLIILEVLQKLGAGLMPIKRNGESRFARMD